MSDYNTFLAERDKIDFYIQKGYVIREVEENLSGAFVTFECQSSGDKEVLHVLTADARKYFSILLLKQV